MRAKTELFQINGLPMLAPDEEVAVSYEDLDDYDSGRDEAGFMRRSVVRYKVGSWKFSYSHLTEEEKQYMESIFPDAPSFQFRHPSRKNAEVSEVTRCYRSNYGIFWKNAVTGLWSGYGFTVIEC